MEETTAAEEIVTGESSISKTEILSSPDCKLNFVEPPFSQVIEEDTDAHHHEEALINDADALLSATLKSTETSLFDKPSALPNSNDVKTSMEHYEISSEILSGPPVQSLEEPENNGHMDSTLTTQMNKDSEKQNPENQKKLEDIQNVSGPTDNSVHAKPVNPNRGIIDTTAPFESVKEAVSKLGGIVDWKAQKIKSLERRKHVQRDLEKVRQEIPVYRKQSEAAEAAKSAVVTELESTKQLIEELKLDLERSQIEESQAKQDSELAQLRFKEMEQGIADEASVAAKAQLDLAKSRHEAAIAELKSVKEELRALQEKHALLVNERDMFVAKAEAAVSASKESEKRVEDLTIELIAAKESLESAHAAHLEAEEHRIGAALAREQDCLMWDKELKQAEEELRQLNEQLLSTKDLKSKLNTANTLLLSLKAELAAYMETKLSEEEAQEKDEAKKTRRSIQEALDSMRKEIEEVKGSIERAKNEVNCLKVAASSLKSELDTEKAALIILQQREGMASIAVSSLEAELTKTQQEIEMVRAKEKETREKMAEFPRLLQQAAQEADESKSAAQAAQEELRKAKEESDQVNAYRATAEIRLRAVLKEIEAAKASERLALAAVDALQESEEARSTGEDSPRGVTLSLNDYFALSKRAHEAEELASERVTTALAQVESAKESESKSLEMLNRAYEEMDEKKEALRVAMERAEKAAEGKLGAEQGLRKWRAENEQRRKAGAVNPLGNPRRSFKDNKEEDEMLVRPTSEPKLYVPASSPDESVADHNARRRKKKSIFPKIVMLVARKKAQGGN